MSTEDEKISRIYQSAKHAEPPAHLDETILAASRNVIKHKSRTTGPFSGSWPVTFSIAALVIITVVIVPVTMHETPDNKPISDYETGMAEPQEQKLAPKKKLRQNAIPGNEQQSMIESETRTLLHQEKYNLPASTATLQPVAKAELIQLGQLGQQTTRPGSTAGNSGFDSLVDNKISGTATLNGRLEKQAVVREQILFETKSEYTPPRTRTPVDRITRNGLHSNNMTAESDIKARAPDAWLKTIKQLLYRNETDKAKREFEAFRKIYPDYIVDKKLLDRLEQLSTNDNR